METNRREILRMAGGAAFLAGIAPLAAGWRGGVRSDLGPAPAKSAAAAGLDPRLARILRAASLAPSGHNSQPWFVRTHGPNTLIVGADPGRRLPAVDPENREVMLSIGAFVENLCQAARAVGLAATTRMIAADASAEEIVRIDLHETRPAGDPWARIAGRMTPKHGFRDTELRGDDLRALTEPMGGRAFHFPRGSRHASCIRELVVECFRIQTLRDEAQRELVRWVRLTRADAERHRDGLSPESMEIRGLKGWYVRRFMEPEDFMGKRVRRQSIDQAARLAGEGAGWLVLGSPGRTVEDLIDTGRRFERMALLARERGVGIHPMTQILEEEVGRRAIASSHEADPVPQFVLRVGYLDPYPEPVSLRRPVSAFLRT